MINNALNPISITSPEMNADWLTTTAEKMLAAMEQHRSTWQSWHVRAEALRHIRAAEITDKVDQLGELLVTEVLHSRSVALTGTEDGIFEPQATWPPSSTGASQSPRRPTQVRCPGSRAFHQPFKPIPSGDPTWQSDPNSSPTSPTRSKITPAKVTARQPGLQREVTRAPPSSAKSQSGGPPTA
jgi:hypothetical protein